MLQHERYTRAAMGIAVAAVFMAFAPLGEPGAGCVLLAALLGCFGYAAYALWIAK